MNFKQPNQHTYFVLCGEGLNKVMNGGSITLSAGYLDYLGKVHPSKEEGKVVKYIKTRTYDGKEIPQYFRFDTSFKRLQSREHDKDFFGVSQIEFLKNYPTCEGSPYGTYQEDENGRKVQVGVEFRIMNEAQDARVALEADRLVTRAKSDALALDEETLSEIGALIGVYGAPDDMMRFRVVEYAGKRPNDYFNLLATGDRAVRAIVRKAKDQGVFKQKGTSYYWEETLIGADEDGAVTTLLKDRQMIDALQDRLGLKADIQTEKKGRGNPAFVKKDK